MTATRHRLLVFAGLAILPWTVVVTGGVPTLFFTVGFLNLDPFALTTITDYYFAFTEGLPGFLNAYGIGVGLFVLATGSAATGLVGREDERVTAALLVLAGISQATFALGFLRRPGVVAVPVGTVFLWGTVWWYYWPSFRALLTGAGGDPS